MIKSRRMRWAGHVAKMGQEWNAYGILVGKAEGKIQLGRPRRKWVDSIRMDLRERGWGGMDWNNREGWRQIVQEAKAHPEL
jgi:hypothetical protein